MTHINLPLIPDTPDNDKASQAVYAHREGIPAHEQAVDSCRYIAIQHFMIPTKEGNFAVGTSYGSSRTFTGFYTPEELCTYLRDEWRTNIDHAASAAQSRTILCAQRKNVAGGAPSKSKKDLPDLSSLNFDDLDLTIDDIDLGDL